MNEELTENNSFPTEIEYIPPSTNDEKLFASTKKIFDLVDRGLPMKEAYHLVKPHKEITQQGISALSKKYSQYSLTQPKRVKQASLVIDKILKGEHLDDDLTIKPKSSDIVRVVEMIVDRAEPKQTINQNLNVNTSVSVVDLSKYLSANQ